MTKEKLLDVVKNMPDSFELEALFKRLLLLERLEEGIRQSRDGETISELEAKAYLSRWLIVVNSSAQ